MGLKQEILEQIKDVIGEANVFEEEPMSEHTSMEVGGPAAYLFQPETAEDTAFLLKILQQENCQHSLIASACRCRVERRTNNDYPEN